MLIKYSLHAVTYIWNLPFSFLLVFLIVIAFIPSLCTPNACYIKISKKTNKTNACYISVNYIWYSRLCSKTKRTVKETFHFTSNLYVHASLCQRRIYCFVYGRSYFPIWPPKYLCQVFWQFTQILLIMCVMVLKYATIIFL